jgi:hypothetical protein
MKIHPSKIMRIHPDMKTRHISAHPILRDLYEPGTVVSGAMLRRDIACGSVPVTSVFLEGEAYTDQAARDLLLHPTDGLEDSDSFAVLRCPTECIGSEEIHFFLLPYRSDASTAAPLSVTIMTGVWHPVGRKVCCGIRADYKCDCGKEVI